MPHGNTVAPEGTTTNKPINRFKVLGKFVMAAKRFQGEQINSKVRNCMVCPICTSHVHKRTVSFPCCFAASINPTYSYGHKDSAAEQASGRGQGWGRAKMHWLWLHRKECRAFFPGLGYQHALASAFLGRLPLICCAAALMSHCGLLASCPACACGVSTGAHGKGSTQHL